MITVVVMVCVLVISSRLGFGSSSDSLFVFLRPLGSKQNSLIVSLVLEYYSNGPFHFVCCRFSPFRGLRKQIKYKELSSAYHWLTN